MIANLNRKDRLRHQQIRTRQVRAVAVVCSASWERSAKMGFLDVAWVPEVRDRSWEDAAILAAAWAIDREVEGDSDAVVMANTLSASVPRVLRRWPVESPRSDRRGGSGVGPVVTYVPAPETLWSAERRAQESSLLAIEGTSYDLRGWAGWHRALDLATGKRDDRFPVEARDALSDLHQACNNDFSDRFEQSLARRYLDDLAVSDESLIAGALLALGHSPKGLTRLGLRVPSKHR